MWDVDFYIERTNRLTDELEALGQEVTCGIVDSLIGGQQFFLKVFFEEIFNYGANLPKSQLPLHQVLEGLADAPKGGIADFRGVFRKFRECKNPTIVVLIVNGPIGPESDLELALRAAPEHLILFGINLAEPDDVLGRLCALRNGEAYSCSNRDELKSTLSRLLPKLVRRPAALARRILWTFKEELDSFFGPDHPESGPPKSVFELFQKAVAASCYTEHVEMVEADLLKGKAGLAYSWFGAALASLEQMTASPVLDFTVLEIIRDIEGDLVDRLKQVGAQSQQFGKQWRAVKDSLTAALWSGESLAEFKESKDGWLLNFRLMVPDSEQLVELQGEFERTALMKWQGRIELSYEPESKNSASFRDGAARYQLKNWVLNMELQPNGTASGRFSFQVPSLRKTCAARFAEVAIVAYSLDSRVAKLPSFSPTMAPEATAELSWKNYGEN